MNTAILWDIENVTPPRGTNYIQAIVDALSEKNKISYAMAFGDWSQNNIKNIAGELAANSFELIHTPHQKKVKDSSDMSLVAHGVELIFQYPHIEQFVLVSGDADFRPLLQSLRKYGKHTLIVCDVTRNASEDLLKMADNFWDYRDFISSEDDDEDYTDSVKPAVSIKSGKKTNKPNHKPTTKKQSQEQAFELLKDAINYMLKENKTPQLGAVKIRMKLLNSGFDEQVLGYRTWKSFINDAVSKTDVEYANDEGNELTLKKDSKQELPEVFTKLLKEIKGKGLVPFNEVAKHLPYRDYGYSRFKKLAMDAEKRGLVHVENIKRTWLIEAV
ncbi:MAG TPA: NYN domain-containing protein [Treponemataceae bacterium]|nr:NYN domain-containing protein [Treponemataceae bacterium]